VSCLTVIKQYIYAIVMESIIQQLYDLYTTAAAKRQQRQVKILSCLQNWL
jgi:hypothetical protein